MGPKWEALTVTPQLLYIGQPELIIWRYVDTKLTEGLLDVLDTWMISILSSILLMDTILIRLLSNINGSGLLLDYDISERDQGA